MQSVSSICGAQGAKQHCHNVGNEEISLLREYHAGLEQLPVLLHSVSFE